MAIKIPADAQVEFNGEFSLPFGEQDADFQAQFDGVEPEFFDGQNDFFDGNKMSVKTIKCGRVCFLGDKNVTGVEVSNEDLLSATERLIISWVVES